MEQPRNWGQGWFVGVLISLGFVGVEAVAFADDKSIPNQPPQGVGPL
jgi:hypothetical protein